MEFVSSISDYRLTKEQKTFAKVLEKSVSRTLHREKITSPHLIKIYAKPLNALLVSNFGPPIGCEKEFLIGTVKE